MRVQTEEVSHSLIGQVLLPEYKEIALLSLAHKQGSGGLRF